MQNVIVNKANADLTHLQLQHASLFLQIFCNLQSPQSLN